MGQHVLVKEECQSPVGGVAGGIVMLDYEFPVSVPIHPTSLHAGSLLPYALTEMPQCLDVGVCVDHLLRELDHDGTT